MEINGTEPTQQQTTPTEEKTDLEQQVGQEPQQTTEEETPTNKEQPKEDNEKENKEDKKDNKPQTVAPENYDFKDVQLPEGMSFDEELLNEFTPLLKEDNLSQEQANRYMQLAVRLVEKQSNNLIEQFKQAQSATIAQYQNALNQDKEIYGADTKQTDLYLDVADKGYNFFSEETRAELNKYGLNYCPALIKDMKKLGDLFKNDTIPQGGKPVATEQTPAQILYGNNSSNQ